MDSERLRIAGPRELKATLDSPDGDTEAVVVACPPHPQMGGDRRDARLRAVSEALCDRGVACLRVDYGPYDEGRAERGDVRRALAWGRDRYARTGLFGYSFGAGVALVAASEECADGTPPAAVSVLAPPASSGGTSTVAAVDRVEPLQIVYGERDSTVDWEPVVERARERSASVASVDTGHLVTGAGSEAATLVAEFLAGAV